jgi:hypothetical protein
MPAGLDFAQLSEDLAHQMTLQNENILMQMLIRHYGTTFATAQDAFAQLERDGLVLTKLIHPAPNPAEFVLHRGPKTQIGQRLDESRVIDRVAAPAIFNDALIFPGIQPSIY